MDSHRTRIAPTLTPDGSAPDPAQAGSTGTRPPLPPELPGLSPPTSIGRWVARRTANVPQALAGLQPLAQRFWHALLPWLRRLQPWLRPARLALYARTTLRLAGRSLVWLVVTLSLLSLLAPGAVLWLRFHPPPTTAFMLDSPVQPVDYRWVPREQIPEALRKAVVAAEDQKFWTHWGFDFVAIAEALEHNKKSRRTRGASTITQQTAKNLFLWPSRSWLRKGLEVGCTLLLEGLWDKERILEVYLNVAEFGPGIYGVEAAAQRFFHKPAAKLTVEESVLLVAVLPNPKQWHADRPGPYVRTRAERVLALITAPPEPEEEETGDWLDQDWMPEDGLPDGALPADEPPGSVPGAGEAGAEGTPAGADAGPEDGGGEPYGAGDTAPSESPDATGTVPRNGVSPQPSDQTDDPPADPAYDPAADQPAGAPSDLSPPRD